MRRLSTLWTLLLVLPILLLIPASAAAQVCDGTDIENLNNTGSINLSVQDRGQSFTVNCVGVIKSISFLRSGNFPNNVPTTLTVRTTGQPNTGVVLASVPVTISGGGYIEMTLPEPVLVKPGQYNFSLAQTNESVGLWVSGNDYAGGSAFSDTFPRGDDLVFIVDLEPAIVVTSTADNATGGDGACTLREALNNVNNGNNDTTGGDCAAAIAPGTDFIVFDIAGAGPHTITPTSALPAVTSPVILDATTQAGAVCGTTPADHTLLIELDGSSVGPSASGFHLLGNSEGSVLRGFVINRFSQQGVLIENTSDVTVECNFLGTNVAGMAAAGNVGGGVILKGSTGSQIHNNLVSGNLYEGIHFEPGGDSNTVTGNFVGTNAAGTAALGNSAPGIGTNQARDNVIGGAGPGEGNLISGNSSHGILILGFLGGSSDGNSIVGNRIGTDVSGNSALPNQSEGVAVVGYAQSNALEDNLISGNLGAGVLLGSSTGNVHDTSVFGNLIGTNGSGTAPLGNGGAGVEIASSDNLIGDPGQGAGNTIAYNGGAGVAMTEASTSGNQVRGNAIYANTGLGIARVVGANNDQSAPALTQVATANGNVTITGVAAGPPNQPLELDFFFSDVCDGSGAGEGRLYLGSATVSTDATGQATFSEVFPDQGSAHRIVTATATHAYNTSVFSPCAYEAGPIVVTTTADNVVAGDGVCTLREALLNANADADTSGGDCRPGDGEDTIAFDITGAGPHTIQPASELPNVNAPVVIDGTTQAGATCGMTPAGHNLLIELDGRLASGSVDGLALLNGSVGSTVRGLVINRFTDKGIRIQGGNDNLVECNFIGTDVAGSAALGNGGNGIEMAGATGNVVRNNLVSGNEGDGVHFEPGGNGNFVRGNFIGTDAAGNAAIGNRLTGIGSNQGANNIIGGGLPGEGNVISGNLERGIALSGTATTLGQNNRIFGNFIGTNAAGTVAVPNVQDGIVLGAYTNGTVIGTDSDGTNDAGEGNLISGNGRNGVLVNSATGVNAVIAGNRIGLDATGTAALGNGTSGVSLNTPGGLVGGTTPEARNVISGNGNNGVDVGPQSSGIHVQGNYIGTNAAGDAAIGNAASGVSILGGQNNTVGGTAAGAGNVISGNSNGVSIAGYSPNPSTLVPAENHRVEGNLIGTDAAGQAAVPNQFHGIVVFDDAPNNTIGGATADAGNLISGNGFRGVRLQGEDVTGTRVQGNYIGTNADGNAALANSQGGVQIDGAPDNFVGTDLDGTDDANEGNLISGNTGNGIELSSNPTATDNLIAGNLIGLKAAGDAALANSSHGVMIYAPLTTVGGASQNARNVISGNGDLGIYLSGNDAESNVIQGNYIGTNIGGDAAVPNGTMGIRIQSADLNLIGGGLPGEGNVISGHSAYGIFITSSIQTNPAEGNMIFGNYIGTDATGTVAIPNQIQGIRLIRFVSGTRIGTNSDGTNDAGEGNVISGNGSGVYVQTDDDEDIVIAGNIIGLDATGTAALALPGGSGISLSGPALVGGTSPAARNVISGNRNAAVHISADAPGTRVIGNFIGTNITGDAVVENGGSGVTIAGSSGNTVGGTAPGEGNVISGNSNGITIVGPNGSSLAASNLVVGNYIGTDAAGLTALPNRLYGISITGEAPNNIIGGAATAARNLISGNDRTGVRLEGPGVTGTRIQGNYIGTDVGGTTGIPNTWDGVQLVNAPNTVIGSDRDGTDDVAEGNLIRGNLGAGITIEQAGSTNTVVAENELLENGAHGVSVTNAGTVSIANNYIGTDRARQFIRGNGAGGIIVLAIGEALSGIGVSDNVIVGNRGAGIAAEEQNAGAQISGLTFSRNIIYNNRALEIDLLSGGSGVTPNDAGDGDTGPNGLLNFPVIDRFSLGTNEVTVEGRVQTTPSTTVFVDLYTTAVCDASGYGGGQVFLGDVTVITDGTGTGSFVQTFPLADDTQRVLTATATDVTGNSSEFGPCAAPTIGVPSGYVFTVLANELAQPQTVIPDGTGGWIVSLVDGGQVIRLDAQGNQVGTVLFNMQVPLGLAHDGQSLYVADSQADAIYKIALSSVNLDATTLTPLASGLGGPAQLTLGPDGALYAGTVQGNVSERVVRIDLGTGAETDVATFFDAVNTNPEGLAFAPNGDLYVALNGPGTVVRIPANATLPVDGTTLTPVLSGLTRPTALDFGPDGRLYIATQYGIKALRIGATAATDFVTGLAGNWYNGVVFDGVVMVAGDASAGRLVQVTTPKVQTLSAMPMTYMLHSASLNAIGPDATTAVQNAFATWAAVPGSDAAFINGGTTGDATAGIDGVNKVTVDDTFPFPPLVLAIAAKTIEFGDTPGEGRIIDADVVINPAFVGNSRFPIGTDAEPGTFDLQSIVTHEVGHVLGLVHSGVEDATMYFVLQPQQGARTLTTDDAAWAGFRYPSATAPATGSIAGTILDGVAAGTPPVAGALVLATETTTGQVVHTYSDEYGAYLVPNLPLGDYTVTITPLAGALRPGNVSVYLQTITNNLKFQRESWNDTQESADPATDDPNDAIAVSVGGAVNGINFLTNRDNTPPTVAGVFPKVNASNASTKTDIFVTFSEFIQAGSLTLEVSTGGTPITGTVEVENDGTLAFFTPAATLTPSTTYTIRVAAGALDASGNALAANFTSTFTTEPPDTAAPTVDGVEPSDNATGVVTTRTVTIAFSEPMDEASVTAPGNLSVLANGVPVNGLLSLTPDRTVATFVPAQRLAEGSTYTVEVAPSVTDEAGNAVSAFSSSFQTGVNVVAVTSVGPANGAGDIAITAPILADFSAPIDTGVLSTTTLQLLDGSASQVPGVFELLKQNTRVIFRPAAPLAGAATYTIIIPGGPGSLQDDTAPTYQSTFTTVTTPIAPQISALTPSRAAIGKTVVISGRGFDPNPANVTVMVGGVVAQVAEATLTGITTTVPKGAASGFLTVTVNGVSSDPFPFDVFVPVPVTEEVVATLSTDSGSRDGAVTPDGAYAFVTNSGANTVSVINIETTTVEQHIPVGAMPLKIALTPDGRTAYVTNFKSSTVSVIDTQTRVPSAAIEVGLNPVGIAITPDGTRAYVAELNGRSISVIDVDPSSGAANSVVATLSTDSGNRDVAMSPDGTQILVTGTLGITIIQIDPTTPKGDRVLAVLSTDSGTRSAEISPDGGYGFVTTMDGQILVIDMNPSSNSAYQVLATTSTDSGARDTEMTPDGSTLFATNFDGGTVTAYKIEASFGAVDAVKAPSDAVLGLNISLVPVDTFNVGLQPEGIVFAPSAGLAIVANSGSNDVSIIRFGQAPPPPPTPEERIAGLQEDVQALVDNGELKKGHGKALQAHLKNALKKLTGTNAQRFAGEEGDNSEAKKDKGKDKDKRGGDKRDDNPEDDEDDDDNDDDDENERTRDVWGAIKQLDAFVKKADNFMAQGKLQRDAGEAMTDTAREIKVTLQEEAGSGTNGLVAEVDELLPTAFALAPNYPNPFSQQTHIVYDVPNGGAGVQVELKVYDMLGRVVATLVDDRASAGRHMVVWDGRQEGGMPLANGVYIVRMRAADFTQVLRLVLVR